jgi:hypothetical protein
MKRKDLIKKLAAYYKRIKITKNPMEGLECPMLALAVA